MTITSDDIKAAVRLEDLIHEDEPLIDREHQRYVRGQTHDSLVVDRQRQCYYWNSRGESGDVYTWLKDHRGLSHQEAMVYLAQRFGLEMPRFSAAEQQALEERRAREDVFGVAARFFHEELLKSSVALDYVRSRGWSIEPSDSPTAISEVAELGYWSGNTQRLREFFSEHAIDPTCPAAVAVLGLRGDIAAWAKHWRITPRLDWLRNDAIPATPGHMVIYSHNRLGRVTYLAGRAVGEKRHYNLPVELAGEKQSFFNQAWTPQAARVVVVEGQADAITLGCWNVPAIGLAGSSADDRLLAVLRQHGTILVGLDNDPAGEQKRAAILDALDPLTRVVTWPAKDANEWLTAGATADDCAQLLKAAPTWLDVVLERVQQAEDEQRDDELRHAFKLLVKLEAFVLARRRAELVKQLGLSSETFEALLKQARRDVGLDEHGRPQYEATGGRLFHRVYDSLGHERLVVLAHFSAQIVTDVLEDDGENQVRRFEIEGRLPNGQPLPRIEVEASEFAQMIWPLLKWGYRAVMAAGAAARDHSRAAILMLSQDVEMRNDYSHTGWRVIDGQAVYLTSTGAVGLEGVRVRLDQNLSRYQLPQWPQAVTEAMRASLRFWAVADYDISIPLWAAMFLAPLASLVPLFFTLWLFGTTGSLKSTLVALALSHFGRFAFNTPPASWTATHNALEKLAFVLKDCPLWIDDFTTQSTVAGQQDLLRKTDTLLRNWGNGAGRTRMRADLSLRQTFAPRGLIISTAEQLPPIESINSRLFQIESGPGRVTRGEGSPLTVAQQTDAPQYGQAMAGYILWIGEQWAELEKSLPALQIELTERARNEGGAHLRLPANIATLYIGLHMGVRYARHVAAVTDEEAASLLELGWNILMGVGSRQQEIAVEEKPVDLYFSALEQLFAQGTAYLRHKDAPEDDARAWPSVATRTANCEFLGWFDDKYWYLLPRVAFNAVYRFYKSAGTIFPDTERGVRMKLLEQKRLFPNRDRFTYQLRLSGSSKVRVLRVGRPDVETEPSSLEAGTAGTTVTTGTEEE